MQPKISYSVERYTAPAPLNSGVMEILGKPGFSGKTPPQLHEACQSCKTRPQQK